MNIKQMIENGSNALFLVSAADLKEFGLALIAEALQQPQQLEHWMVFDFTPLGALFILEW